MPGTVDSDRLGEDCREAVRKYQTETKKVYTVSFTYYTPPYCIQITVQEFTVGLVPKP